MSVEYYHQRAMFALVAGKRSFTRAAAQLGHVPAGPRQLHAPAGRAPGCALLARTTRSVLPTEAGEQLLRVIAPRFEKFDNELIQLNAFRDKPAGRQRITVVQPVLGRLLPDHPDLNIEVIVDYGLTHIVTEGFDAGIRIGETRSPCASGQTCAWLWSARRPTFNPKP